MTTTIPAKSINLRFLIEKFGLQRVKDSSQFFPEWQEELPEITDLEKQLLDQVQEGFINLLDYPPVLEDVVRMAVIDPILFMGGFFRYPYYIRSEEPIYLELEDQEIIIKGKLDTLVLKDQLWVMVIESKRVELSTQAGLAQILTYMLANPQSEHPTYGMITTGESFVFLKLVQGNSPQYARSQEFITLNPGNELYQVMRILKHLSQITINNANSG